jgi:hypothetical protein
MIQWIKQLLSEEGFASSTRLVKLLIVFIFCGDWVYTRAVDKIPFTPPIEILGFISVILGFSLAQKYIEKK